MSTTSTPISDWVWGAPPIELPTGWVRFDGKTLDVYGEPWMSDSAVSFRTMPDTRAVATVLLDHITAISWFHR